MQLKKRITLSGLNPNELNAVLITHEHTDHTKGLEVLSKTVPVPVYCNSLTHEAIAGANGSVKSWKLFENGNPFMIGDIEVCGFSVMHDAADPVGFTFERNDNKIGFISDVGHVNQLLISSVKDVQNLFIEANYDETLLQNDNKRPWSLKQRIASRHGHLSNRQTAEFVASIAEQGNLKNVILGHLSNDCNSPEVARAEIILALSNCGISGIEVNCASRNELTGPFILEDSFSNDQGNDSNGFTQEEFPLFS
jgi:phosphoribosyl 1,2-cyclic phosphodiesterase